MKNGFSAYEEIQGLAFKAYKGKFVAVISEITGDNYIISVDHKEVLKGNTIDVRNALTQMVSQ